ncbi:MAG: LysE family translocator [Dehalococcoidia bacterium]
MPSIETLLAFTAATFVMLVVPGPVVLYVSARSASQGLRAGLISVWGVHTATLIHVAAAAFGVSAILAASATAFSVVKLAGAGYLVYLGARALLGARRETREVVAAPPRASRRLFIDGFTVNLLNPKSAVFFLAYFPQFVTPGSHAIAQTLFLGALVVLFGVLSDSVYAALGARVGHVVRGRSRARRVGHAAEGATLVGLGVALAVRR